jgi:hypothetical protein
MGPEPPVHVAPQAEGNQVWEPRILQLWSGTFQLVSKVRPGGSEAFTETDAIDSLPRLRSIEHTVAHGHAQHDRTGQRQE